MISERNTRQKEYILKCLKQGFNKHLSSGDILNTLKESKTPVSKATVYRYLAKAQKDGLVRKYKVGSKESSCYQYIDKNSECCEHYHLLCHCCSKTVHFQNGELSTLLNNINSSNNFYIDASKTVFYGLCKQCKNKEKESAG
ncbi:MAG: Fur family transcriptional regulator [Eubacteriales bacterium SKADARSKE-1]|nr:Fur family transcriptional regulator [Eubacteriales bacterium SKADARSKE-1]